MNLLLADPQSCPLTSLIHSKCLCLKNRLTLTSIGLYSLHSKSQSVRDQDLPCFFKVISFALVVHFELFTTASRYQHQSLKP